MTTHQNPMTVHVDGQDYQVRVDGERLTVGQVTDGETTWYPDALPLDALPADARTALDAGSAGDEALVRALRGVVSAYSDRGA